MLWQDVRARALDEQLGSDRRVVGERVAGWMRWIFLVAFALALGMQPVRLASLMSAGVLLAWAAVNVAVAIALARRWRPSRATSIVTLAMDFAVGTALVYLSLGAASLIGLAFFLVFVAGSIRLGIAATLGSAVATSLAYGIAVAGSNPVVAIGQTFMFVTLALIVGLMSQELERERRIAIARAAQTDAMREMSVTLGSSLELKDVFSVVLQHGLRLTGADSGGLVLVFEEGVDVAAGEPLEEAAARAAAGRGEPDFLDQGARLLVPLASGDGVTAVLWLGRRSRPFVHEDVFTVNALAGSVAVPLGNALRYRRSTQEAARDAVTGLLNHREMRRRLEAELAWRRDSAREMAFILLDLDHFKQVNDSLGHQHGDLVLRTTAKVVRETVRAHDLVARYGGDEMAVIVLDSTPDGAEALAQRLLDAIHRAHIATSPGASLTLSLGVASFPADALTADELVMAADQALYVSKRSGRDRVTSCRGLVARVAADEPALLAMLRDAGPQVALAAGHALDARFGTPGRSSAVAVLAERLARRAAPASDLETLRAAAFVQDAGRLVGPVETHAETGAQLLAESHFPAAVVEVVRRHHERWTSSDSTAPVEARVLAIADGFESLVSGREGPPLSPSQALERLEADRGGFDPSLVAALRGLIDEQGLPPLPAPAPAELAETVAPAPATAAAH